MNELKTKFCLRTTGSIQRIPLLPFVILLMFSLGSFLFVIHWKFFIIVQFPAIVFALIGIYVEANSQKERFYIDGSDVYVAGWCSYKIDLQEIKGIKIMQMYTEHDIRYTPWHYKDGRPIYLIILLSEINAEMYNFKYNERRFSECFGEYIIEEAEYDPEAVKYLKTLNPDIKVFY